MQDFFTRYPMAKTMWDFFMLNPAKNAVLVVIGIVIGKIL